MKTAMHRATGAVLEVALWATAAAALGAAMWAARWTPTARAEAMAIAAPESRTTTPDAAALGRWRDRVVARDPFRLLRRASPIAFTVAMPEQGLAAATMPMRPPKPALVLRGLVGGPPWEAVLDGVPGRERGVVARAGDVLGGTAELRVRRVGADGVVITGMDTTWRLTVGGTMGGNPGGPATPARRAP